MISHCRICHAKHTESTLQPPDGFQGCYACWAEGRQYTPRKKPAKAKKRSEQKRKAA